MSSTAENVTSTPSAMYTVIDGLSNTSGRKRLAVNDHSRMASETLVHAALGDSPSRSAGTAVNAASAGSR